MTRIKICGITSARDALTAAEAGADAVGLVLAESPRRVSPAAARQIVAALPPFVSAVGVFVNAAPEDIRRVAGEAALGEVQLHGDESPADVRALAGLRVIKALRVRDATFPDRARAFIDAGAAALLFDAYSPVARGGTGKRIDWDLVDGARQSGGLDAAVRFVLAGGLTPMNVASAIRRLRPWGVDVSSGVELEPGVKCADRIGQFVAAVRSAD